MLLIMKAVTKFMGLIYVLCVKLKVYVHVEFDQVLSV